MKILIAGESGSGKTTLAEEILKEGNALILSLDDFYFGKDERERPPSVGEWGNDPAYCDVGALAKVIYELDHGRPTLVPQFSFITQDKAAPKLVYPEKNIIVEGLWALTFPTLRALADETIYLDVPEEERIMRRIMRDGVRGRNKEQTLSIAPEIESLGAMYVRPYKQYADIVIQNV